MELRWYPSSFQDITMDASEPFPLSRHIHPTMPPQMGEKEKTPDISFLIGGKIGDRDNHLNEFHNPYIGLLHEIEEETGTPLNPQNLTHELTSILPHKEQIHHVHLYSGRIAKEHLRQINPPHGYIETVNIRDLKDAPLDNDVYLSPMSNYLVQLYKDNMGKSREEFHVPVYEAHTGFIKPEEFQNYINIRKESLAQHPA
jgi:hypothetical protein